MSAKLEHDSYDDDSYEDAYFDGEDLDEDWLYDLHGIEEDELEEFEDD